MTALKKTVVVIICLLGLTSFQNYKINYSFHISTSQAVDKIPKSIAIQITNNGNSQIQLDGLYFDLYIDEDGFWGNTDSKLFNEKIFIKPKGQFNKTIIFDSLAFASYIGHKTISVNNIKSKIKSSSKFSIRASVHDMRRLENSQESSTLAHSNVVELKKS